MRQLGRVRKQAAKAALRSRSSPRLIALPISFRTSTDVGTVQDVLSPFINLDNDSTYRNDENEKYNCLDDHFLNLR
jgi:hypothetical protein